MDAASDEMFSATLKSAEIMLLCNSASAVEEDQPMSLFIRYPITSSGVLPRPSAAKSLLNESSSAADDTVSICIKST